MHELISKVQTPNSAQQLLELIRDFIQSQEESDDFEAQMSDDQVATIQEGVERSHDSKNLIPQADAKKMLEAWLSQKR